MALATLLERLTLDLLPRLFWVLMNNKVVGLVSGTAACILICKTDGRFRGQRALAIGAAVYLAVRAAVFLWFYESWDFANYHQTGRAVLGGTDPYRNLMNQYPVNALPLFSLFALLPVRVASALWYAFNIAALLLALRLGQLITEGPDAADSGAPWYRDAHVILAVLLAGATTWALDAGQIVVWTTLWVYVGIHALSLGKQAGAGLSLAAGSLKITTSLPFLLLPLDRRYWKALVFFGIAVVALCLCAYPPDRLPELIRSLVANVSGARQEGEVNDYGFAGPYHDDLLGLEHWLYCLGLRDRGLIPALQLAILGFLALGLLWDFRLSSRPRDDLLAAVLLCLYSCNFLYHRIYDAVIVALPIFYCVERARQSCGARATIYKGIATGLVLVLNFPRGGALLRLAQWSRDAGILGRLFQIVAMPYCTWILLISLCLLWYLGRRPEQEADPDQFFSVSP
jgi:hypothetical protein